MRRAPVPRVSEKRSKYGAKPTVVDGVRFASQKEAARYRDLKLLEQAGQISGLVLQQRFDLEVCGVCIGRYVADFEYLEREGGRWQRRVEDVKGYRTPLYRWKKKHFEAQYNAKIREVS